MNSNTKMNIIADITTTIQQLRNIYTKTEDQAEQANTTDALKASMRILYWHCNDMGMMDLYRQQYTILTVTHGIKL